MTLLDRANSAIDKTSFIEFMTALQNDFVNNPETWENVRIDMFLDAIKSWVEDYHAKDIDFENPNWKTISAMFYMGKLYE